MSYYKPLYKRNRGNQRAPLPPGHYQGDKHNVTMGRHAEISPKSNDVKPFIWPYNQPPTFSGAKYWVDRHQRDFKTFAHLLELYPNLLQSEGLSSLREFMIPPENLPNHFTSSSNPSQFYTQSNTEPSQGTSMNSRFVYICDNTSETDFGVSSTKDKLVAALSSYCCVRTSPEQLGSYSECIDIVDIITAADAFVFLMNSRTLNSWFSLHQLGLAIAHDIPVIAVREAGFKLPPVFPPEFHHLEIVKPNSVSTAPRASPNLSRSRSSETKRRTEPAAKDHNEFFSDSELLKRSKQGGENSPLLLADVISGLFRTSLLYVWHLHDSCIAKLFGRLSDFLGESFLDLEISQAHSQTENNSDNLLTVGSDMNQVIVGATSPFRPLPSQQNRLSVLDLPADRKDNVSAANSIDNTRTASADKSRTSTACSPPEAGLKLPPIPRIVGVAVTPSPVPPSRHSTSSTMSTRSSAGTSARTSSRSSAKSAVTATLPNVTSDTLPDTLMNLSPPSSPFVATRYVVFPTEPGGPKKPPYVVCFPSDVFNEEEKLKKELEEDSEDEYKPPEENEDDFDKVRLDVSSDEVSTDRSPFNSPTPHQKPKTTKETEGAKQRKEEVSKSTGNKSKSLNKGQPKTKSKGNGSNGQQNKQIKQDKDKKIVKVSRVEMRFHSNGKSLP